MRQAIVAALLLLIAAGCAPSKKVYSANGTTVTTDENQKTVTVQSSAGTMKMGKGVVDVNALGVPIYAGATQDDSAVSMTDQRGLAQMVAYSTPDSFDRVYLYYRGRLPRTAEKMNIAAGGGSIAEFVTGGAKVGDVQTMVMISRKNGGTSIVITKGKRTR